MSDYEDIVWIKTKDGRHWKAPRLQVWKDYLARLRPCFDELENKKLAEQLKESDRRLISSLKGA